MALTTNEPKALTAAFSDRQVDWISQFNASAQQLHTTEQKRNFLEQCMHNSTAEREAINNLVIESHSHLIPESELKWVEKTISDS